MSDLAQQDFQRILLIKPSSLGDIIHALPVLNGLCSRYPGAKISWLVNTEYAGLLKDHPQLDEVIPFDRQKFKSFFGAIRATFGLGGFASELHSRRFDLAIDLQGLFRSGLMTFATSAPVRLGFSPAREGAGIFYNYRIPVPHPDLHAVDKNYLVAKTLGFEDIPIAFHLPITSQTRDIVRQKLSQKGITSDEPFALILPGSRWETKNWPPEKFSQTIDRLKSQLRLKTVVSGSAGDADLCQLIAQTCEHAPANLAGEIDLTGMVALIAEASVVLCNDSAPLHVAAALRKPLVSIFGPTNPQRTGPHGQLDSVLQAQLPCVPCYCRKLRQCPIQHECMKQITVEHVTHALATLLLPR